MARNLSNTELAELEAELAAIHNEAQHRRPPPDTELKICLLEWEKGGETRWLRYALDVVFHRAIPLPEWLYFALWDELETAAERKADTQRLDAIRVIRAVSGAVHCDTGDRSDPAEYYQLAKEKHFREAADRLNAEGRPYTPAGVKKTWQRWYRWFVGVE